MNNLEFGFCSVLATDFSTYYLDNYNNIPNSLIVNIGKNSIYNGNYSNIYLYNYIGNYTENCTNIILNIPKSKIYLNKKNKINYLNYQEWNIPICSLKINNINIVFRNIIFNPIFKTNNLNQYNLINNYKGFTFPSSIQSWYSTTCSFGNYLYSFQLIWGQGDIPQEYYSICGFAGTTNVQAQNPFTNTNGPYYSTYITSNDNYASNSGWIIVLAGPYDPTLVNPPYLEDI